MTYEAIPAELKDRITAAAQELYEQAERQRFPTVDAVRRHAKADMNSTSAVMREWRKAQQAAPVAVAVAVPEAIAASSTALLAAIWQQAQELASESLSAAQAAWEAERQELDALRKELAEAYEAQAKELDMQEEKYIQQLEIAHAETEAEKESIGALKSEMEVLKSEREQAIVSAAAANARLEAVEKQAAELLDRLTSLGADKSRK